MTVNGALDVEQERTENPPRRGERLAASAWTSGERPREIALANEWDGEASALWIELDAVAESR